MSTSNCHELARRFLTDAVREDTAGNVERALQLYTDGLNFLQEHMSDETNPAALEGLGNRFVQYLNRADYLREVLQSRGHNPAPVRSNLRQNPAHSRSATSQNPIPVQPAVQRFPVKIRSVDMVTFTVHVAPKDTVNDLKDQIYERYDLSRTAIQLCHKGKRFTGNSPLSAYGISQGCTISLYNKLKNVQQKKPSTTSAQLNPDRFAGQGQQSRQSSGGSSSAACRSTGSEFIIRVRCMDKKMYNVSIRAGYSMEEVKKELERTYQLRPIKGGFAYNGKTLENGKVSEYGIQRGCTIVLLDRPQVR